MNTCFIGEFPLPGNSPSAGPENVLNNLVKGINNFDKSINIDILSIHNDINQAFVSEYLPNVFVHYFPRLPFLPRSFGDPIIVKKFLGKNSFDLIHAHYPIALSKIMDTETPKILTLHGMFHLEKEFVSNPFVNLFYHDYNMHMLKKIAPKLDGFVAISPYVISELSNKGICIKNKNIFQINNPIGDSFFSIEKGKNVSNNLIFYPARITERKNQLAAISSIKLVKKEISSLKLVFTGGYDLDYLKKLNDAIISNDLNNVVEYRGKVPRDQILQLYNSSSILWMLSRQETQPMAIIEAMATGTPVIASNINSNSYLVEHGVTGYLVDPDDPIKIAEYTVELLNNKEKRMKMGENAKSVAQKQYHSDAVIEKTLKMYEKVMGSYNGSKLQEQTKT